MKEVMKRLKALQAEVKKLNEIVAALTKTNATLTESNKQLTESNKTLVELIKAGSGETPTGGGGGTSKTLAQRTILKRIKCNICGLPHAKPFVKNCWELEANAHKHQVRWESKLK
jgi:DNA repair exonuclease SbcCD ATPase subunit